MATAGGIVKCNSYFVSIWLPNRLCIPSIKVSDGELTGNNIDLLIGMGIINEGDFAVNNQNYITSFSFRIPSMERIDYVKDLNKVQPIDQDPKNLQCPCGSGIPFNDYHGKKTKRSQRKSAIPSQLIF
jgi:hypothetical protein